MKAKFELKTFATRKFKLVFDKTIIKKVSVKNNVISFELQDAGDIRDKKITGISLVHNNGFTSQETVIGFPKKNRNGLEY